MHILYIDESGNPRSWEDQKHFVLGAAALPSSAIMKGRTKRTFKEFFRASTADLSVFHLTA